MAWKTIPADDLRGNPFETIGKGWFLVTAGTKEKSNAMTVSWGGLGVWWGKNAATVYIREHRFTKPFIDESGRFTLAVLPESQRKALGWMGSHSGRDGDKWGPSGLTPCEVDGVAAPAEADMILLCRVMLRAPLTADTFCDKAMEERWYSGGDEGNYHTMYIAEIEKVLVKE